MLQSQRDETLDPTGPFVSATSVCVSGIILVTDFRQNVSKKLRVDGAQNLDIRINKITEKVLMICIAVLAQMCSYNCLIKSWKHDLCWLSWPLGELCAWRVRRRAKRWAWYVNVLSWDCLKYRFIFSFFLLCSVRRITVLAWAIAQWALQDVGYP